MKLTLIESSVGPGPRQQILASYLVNDDIVIDAGSVGFFSPLEVQRRIKHVFISHSHIDHIASLPIHVENAFRETLDPVRVYGSAAVLEAVQTHLFNDVLWPDFVKLTSEGLPFVELIELEVGRPTTVENLTFTPYPVAHVVPTFAYVVSDSVGAIAILTDTDRPAELGGVLEAVPNLRAMFLEATFPDSMQEMADVSAHLTPAALVSELEKLNVQATPFAIHLKAAFRDQLRDELAGLGNKTIEVMQPGQVYEF